MDPQDLIDVLVDQRNNALNENANLKAMILKLQKQLKEKEAKDEVRSTE